MSYQVLARKWRPKKFQEVIGQMHVTRALQNAVVNKKVGHAYILIGTRGVGKTSVARIFAKAIRCENLTADGNSCGECRACVFRVEINLSGNQRLVAQQCASEIDPPFHMQCRMCLDLLREQLRKHDLLGEVL